MQAVIMAGGQGTRLRSVSGDLPKPMVPVLGKPILEYQIESLKACGITEITLMTGYLGETVRAYFGDGRRFGVRISYFCEERPMGTAGALYYLRDRIGEDFLLIMGDLMLSVDFVRFMEAHRAAGGLATLFVHPNTHPYDSDIIVTDTVGTLSRYGKELCGKKPSASVSGPEAEPFGSYAVRVKGVLGKKEARPDFYHNQVNAGIYALSPQLLCRIPEPSGKVDLDKDIIRPLIEKGEVFAYSSSEYVKDMGTPERYEAVSEDLKNGIVSGRNLSKKQKCIFLDRDGTINKLNGFIRSAGDFELLPGAAEAIAKINRSEYLCIVVTNQPVIARGECSFEELDRIHAKLETLLGEAGACIDGLYYCPHHPDKGFDGEVPSLKFSCSCRKPEPGLLFAAAERFHIDLSASYMIGDMTQDIDCGKNAGTKTVLLKSGLSGEDGKYDITPDAVCSDLLSAAERILKGSL